MWGNPTYSENKIKQKKNSCRNFGEAITIDNDLSN